MVTIGEENKQAFHYHFAARSDIGKRRDENQDAYGYFHSSSCSMFVVADGMGGARGGATASAIAVDVITRFAASESGEITEASLREAIRRANTIIYREGRNNEELSGMGTTVVVVVLSGDRVLIAHVGDSRIYRVRDKKLELLTRDHTLVKELIDSGAISPEQAEHHPIAHMLTRSLGPTILVEVESRFLEDAARVGDRFLLCSDGLYNLVKSDEMERILSEEEIERVSKKLIQGANEGGGTDNITAEVIEVCRIPQPGEVNVVQGIVGKVFVSRAVGHAVDYQVSAEEIEEFVQEANSATDRRIREGRVNNDQPIKQDQEQGVKEEISASDSQGVANIDPIDSEEITAGDVTEGVAKDSSAGKAVAGKKEKIIQAQKVKRRAVRSEAETSNEETTVKDRSSGRRRFAVTLVLVVILSIAYYFIAEEKSGQKTALPVVEETPQETPFVAGEEEADNAAEIDLEEDPLSDPNSWEPIVKSRVPSEAVSASLPQPTELEIAREALEPEVTPVVSEMPAVKDDPDVMRLITEASEMKIPEPPQIDGVPSDVPDQPVDWEKEREARLQAPPSFSQRQSQILSPDEKKQIAKEKMTSRAKIADLDARLQFFVLNTPEQRAKLEQELLTKIAEGDRAIEYSKNKLSVLNAEYERWQTWKERETSGGPAKLAGELAEINAEVKRRKGDFDLASLRYLDSHELWKENQADDKLGSEVAALGRELKARRSELEEAVTQAVDLGLKDRVFQIAEWSIRLSDLERQRNKLSRHIGFLKAFLDPVSAEERRLELKRLFEERDKLVLKIKDLSLRVSDIEEIELRREQFYKRLSPSP